MRRPKLAAKPLVRLFLTGTLLGVSLLPIQSQEVGKSSIPNRDELIRVIYMSYLPMRDFMTKDMWETLRGEAQRLEGQDPKDQKVQMLALLIDGELSRMGKRLDLAHSKFLQASNAAPQDSLPFLGLAETVLDQGQTDQATTMLFIAESQVSKSVPANFQHSCHSRIGELYERAGKFTRAVKAYELAVAKNPNWGQGQRTLARVYIAVNEPAKAFDHVQKAIVVEPKEPLNYFLLGEAQHGLGRSGLAIRAFQKALELDPGNPLYHYSLGLEYEGQGDKIQALRSYLTAQNLAQHANF